MQLILPLCRLQAAHDSTQKVKYFWLHQFNVTATIIITKLPQFLTCDDMPKDDKKVN